MVQLSDAWLRDWLPVTGPEWTVNALRTSGRAEDGAVVFETSLDATAALENNPTQLVLQARGGAKGIEVTQLEVRSSTGVLGHGTGQLPLVLDLRGNPSGTPHARWIRDGELRFEPGESGRLVTTLSNGKVFEIGRITAWAPGEKLAFTWRQATFTPEQSTQVVVLFEAVGDDTRVTVEHRGWNAIPQEHVARHHFPLAVFQLRQAEHWRVLLAALAEQIAGAK